MNERKKTLIQLVSFGIVCFLLGVSFVYAQISQTHVLSGGSYPGAPSYTVWTDNSGNYYVKNAYGVMIYSGNDAVTAIETVLVNDTITVIQPGTYLVAENYGIYFYNVSDIAVYGYGAIIKNNYTGAQIQLFDVRGQNLQFYGLTFDQARDEAGHSVNASLGAQWTVRTGYCTNVLFQDCKLINGLEENYVSGHCVNVVFDNCVFDNAGEHCIYLDYDLNTEFRSCKFTNWGIDHRGYTKIAFCNGIKFYDCYFDIDEDGHVVVNVPDGSYTFAVVGASNETIVRDCQFPNPYNNFLIEPNSWNTRITGCNFTNATRIGSMLAIADQGNFTFMDNNAFYGFTYRLIDSHLASDATISNNYFSGGASSLTIWFGYRSMVIGNYWVPNNSTGAYALGSASGSGVFALNHVCNSTLTFVIPAGVSEYGNYYY